MRSLFVVLTALGCSTAAWAQYPRHPVDCQVTSVNQRFDDALVDQPQHALYRATFRVSLRLGAILRGPLENQRPISMKKVVTDFGVHYVIPVQYKTARSELTIYDDRTPDVYKFSLTFDPLYLNGSCRSVVPP